MVKRSLYYWSKAYISEYTGKGAYANLQRTICINVLDFILLDEEKFHNKYIIQNPNNEKVISLEKKVEELQEAKEELARISRDPKEAENYRMRENARNDRLNALLSAEEKGLKRGIQEGIQEGIKQGLTEGERKAKLEIARTSLKSGLSIEVVSQITGLSLEEIKGL